MICPPCATAADRIKPGLHKMCKSPATCSCQHYAVGYGQVELAQVTVLSGVSEKGNASPLVLRLNEEQQAALDSTGLSLDELKAKINNWEADGHELMVWRILNGEAA